MKKTLKMMATLAALLAMLGFVSCSSDDDDDDGSDQGNHTTAESGSSTTGGSTETTGGSTTESGSQEKSETFSVDITSFDFKTATAGLTDTAASDKNGTYPLAVGDTKLEDGYFTVVQSEKKTTKYYTDKARSKINAIELGKLSDSTYIKFTVTGSADVTVTATSTSGSNTSYLDIIPENGTQSFDSATTVKGSSTTEVTKKGLTAGTYWIVTVADDTRKSNVRITKLEAVQTAN